MTTGSDFQTINVLHPSVLWAFTGGIFQPKYLKHRAWSGSDGKFQVNSYDCTYEETYNGFAHYGYHNTGGFCSERHGWCCGLFPGHPTSVTGAAEPAALSNLISAIIGDDFQMNVTLGEMPTTLSYIYDKIKPILKSFKAFRKGDVYRGFKALGIHRVNGKRIQVQKTWQAPAAYWLEYRYAIRPMLNDISNAMDRLSKEMEKPATKKIRRGSKAVLPCWIYGGSEAYTAQRIYWPDESCIEMTSAGVTIEAGFDYEDVDFRNIAGVAWELIPFSFVADWFAGIGNWLRARHFFHHSSYTKGYVTNYLKYDTGKLTGYLDPSTQIHPPCGLVGENTLDKSFKKLFIIKRRALDASYIPSIGIKHPLTGFDDWKRALDAITLIEQVATGKGKKYRSY